MKSTVLSIFLLLLLFTANGQEKIGINTTSPEAILDIRSGVSVETTLLNLSTQSNNRFLKFEVNNTSHPSPWINWKNGDHLLFGVSNDPMPFQELMRISSSGNLGLGTLDPSGLIHLFTDSDQDSPHLRISENQNDFGRIKFENVPFPDAFWDVSAKTDTVNDDARFNIKFKNQNIEAIRFTLTGNGRLGLGAADPEGKLHVLTNSTLDYPQLKLTENQYDFSRIKFQNILHENAYWDIAGLADSISDKSFLNFFYKGASRNTDIMTLKGNGNVGIGTNAPEQTLHVNGDVMFGGGGSNYDFASEAIIIKSQKSDWFIAGLNDPDPLRSDFFIGKSSSPDAIFHIENQGNIGIGRIEPEAKLDVNGKIKISDDGTPEIEGQIRYNAVDKSFEGFDGTDWLTLSEIKALEQSLTISMASFQTSASSDPMNISVLNPSGAYINDGGVTKFYNYLYVPVNISQQSIIDSIKIKFYDNDSNRDLKIQECYLEGGLTCNNEVITSGNTNGHRDLIMNSVTTLTPGQARVLTIFPVDISSGPGDPPSYTNWGSTLIRVESVTVYYH